MDGGPIMVSVIEIMLDGIRLSDRHLPRSTRSRILSETIMEPTSSHPQRGVPRPSSEPLSTTMRWCCSPRANESSRPL